MTIDLAKIIKRLELIKALISLEEENEINFHVTKLEKQALTEDVQDIIQFLKSKYYSKAVTAIETFINLKHAIAVYIDPVVDALKLEIKHLEFRLNSLSEEKADLEKLILEFGVRHNKELGSLILKLLKYRKEKAIGTTQEKETAEDFQTYEKQFEATKDKQVTALTVDELKELKQKYRIASKLCHPDVVSDVQKELATKLFSDLSSAYQNNNLAKLNEILRNLQKGNFFVNKSDVINEKKLLQAEIEKLCFRVKELKEEIEFIKKSETYNTINSIDSWDKYFKILKQELHLQINQFENGE